MSEKNQKKPKVKYNRFINYAIVIMLVLYARIRLKLRINRKQLDMKQGPFLVLANHCCPVDFLMFSGIFYPKKLNYVVAENMSYRKTYRWFINHSGAIKRQQYTADINSIRMIKNNLDAGISVLLFPEGRVTADGKTGYIPSSIAKLVKFLKYPVVIGKTSGAYICNPKWSENTYYRGGVNLDLGLAFTKEETQTLSTDEIYARIKEKLKHNDQLYQQQTGFKIKGDHRAEGLHTLLFHCPVCHTDGQMSTAGNLLTCDACGHQVEYTEEGRLVSLSGKETPERIDLWYDYERALAAEAVVKDNFELKYDVHLHLVNNKTNFFDKAGEGVLTVSREGLRYKGTSSGEEIEIFVPSKRMPVVSLKLGFSFDLYDDEIYRFVFFGKLLATQASLAIEEVYKANYGEPA